MRIIQSILKNIDHRPSSLKHILMIILMVPQTMIALSIWTVINVYFLNLDLKSVEFPLMIFAVLVLVISFISIRKIKGIKIEFH